MSEILGTVQNHESIEEQSFWSKRWTSTTGQILLVAVDHVKLWPQHQGWDPEIDLFMNNDDNSDSENDDGLDSKDADNLLDIGNDVQGRMTECRNKGDAAVGASVAQRTCGVLAKPKGEKAKKHSKT